MTTNYIRNQDRKKFPVSKLSKDKGVKLSELKGTIAYARSKDVPVYDHKSNLKRGSIGYSTQKRWLIMAKNTISKTEAKRLAIKAGAEFNKDSDEQKSSVMGEIAALAKLAGYRKPKAASGSTGRYFFNYLQKR